MCGRLSCKLGHTVDGCEILHQVIGGKHPIIYRFSTIPGGARFLPSTVCWYSMEHIEELQYVKYQSERSRTNYWTSAFFCVLCSGDINIL